MSTVLLTAIKSFAETHTADQPTHRGSMDDAVIACDSDASSHTQSHHHSMTDTVSQHMTSSDSSLISTGAADDTRSMLEPLSSSLRPTWNLSSPLPHTPDLDSDMQSIAPSALPSTITTTTTHTHIPSTNLPTMMKKVLQYRRQIRKRKRSSQLPSTARDINSDGDNSDGVILLTGAVHPSLVMTPSAIARLKSLGPQRLPPLPSLPSLNNDNSE